MISLCMATYNGEKYITEQLTSILNQSVQPDEVIICDDNSTDQTIKIIKGFIDLNHLHKKWKLYVNEKNKGYPGNFYNVIEKCNYEFIFLSDQDDIWEEDKIERMLYVLNIESHIRVLSCNHGLINEKSGNINSIMAPRKKNTQLKQEKTVEDVLDKFEWPGMTMAIRRSFYHDVMIKNDISLIPHDFALAIIAADKGGFFYYDYLGVYHRRHENNTAKEEHRISKLLNRSNKIKAITDYNRMLHETLEKVVISAEAKISIANKLKLSEIRLGCIKEENIKSLVMLYYRNFNVLRFKSFISDFLIIILKKFTIIKGGR